MECFSANDQTATTTDHIEYLSNDINNTSVTVILVITTIIFCVTTSKIIKWSSLIVAPSFSIRHNILLSIKKKNHPLYTTKLDFFKTVEL